MADVGERPARLDPDVDVHAAPPGGLRVAGVAEFLEQPPGLARGYHRVSEVRAGLRVEIEPQLVRMIDVIGAYRPRVKRDRVHLRRPADDRDLGRTHLVSGTAGGELDAGGLDVVRRALRDPLLKEGVSPALLPGREDHAIVDTLRPALERRRPTLERPHDPVLHRDVVAHDIELGDRRCAVGRGEDDPVWARDAQLAAPGVDRRRIARGHRQVLHELLLDLREERLASVPHGHAGTPKSTDQATSVTDPRPIAPISVSTPTGNTSCGVPAAHHTVSNRRSDASISVSRSVA